MQNNSEDPICAYCKELQIDATKLSMAEHILECEMRPELGLILKNEFLEEMGDNIINALHDVIKLVATIEGTATAVWEVYRVAQESWEIAKNVEPGDLAERARKK